MFQANVPTRRVGGTSSASSTPPIRRVRSVHSAIEVRLRSVAVLQTSSLSPNSRSNRSKTVGKVSA